MSDIFLQFFRSRFVGGHRNVKRAVKMHHSPRNSFRNLIMKNSLRLLCLWYSASKLLPLFTINFRYNLSIWWIHNKNAGHQLLQSPLKLNLLQADSRISGKEYKERIVNGEVHVLVDVRPEHHFRIVSLPRSLNIPLPSLEARVHEISSALEKEGKTNSGSGAQLYVLCRRGNDSQRAVQFLHKIGFTSAKDIVGGLEGWARDVDPSLPMY